MNLPSDKTWRHQVSRISRSETGKNKNNFPFIYVARIEIDKAHTSAAYCLNESQLIKKFREKLDRVVEGFLLVSRENRSVLEKSQCEN